MKKINVLTLAAATILALGGLAGCGNKKPDSTPGQDQGGNGGNNQDSGETVDPNFVQKFVKLEVSSPATQHEILKQLETTYNQQRKAKGKDGVEITLKDIGENDVGAQVTDWPTGPDLFAFASDQISDFYAKGVLSELPPNSEKHVTVSMFDHAVEFAKFAGKVLAYPFAADNTYYMFYDKSQISDPTVLTSIEALMDYAQTKGRKVSYNLTTAFQGIGALFTFGARYNIQFNDDGVLVKQTADFNTEKGLKAAKAIRKIITHKAYMETTTAPGSDVQAPIATVDGGWNVRTYKTSLGDNFGCVPLPTVEIDGETANLTGFLGAKLYGVNSKKSAKNQMAAHDFATFLTGETAQLIRYQLGSVVPTNKKLHERDDVKNDPAVKVIDQVRPNTVPQTAVPASIWGAYDTFIGNVNALIKEGKEVKDEFLASEMETFNSKITTL